MRFQKGSSRQPSTDTPLHSDFNTELGTAHGNDGYDLEKGFSNRFIEQPLIKTRLLHWINFRYGVTGYLHWGYNHWTQESPFTHTTRAHGGPPYLPAGDPWIVYPGKDGPLDSIRFEAMRDGIADYELLCLLAEKNPDAARRLVGQHVLDFDRYDTDVGKFRAARRELLQLAGQLSQDPSRHSQ